MRGTSWFGTMFAHHLHPALDDVFVQHAADVAMARHATGPGSTGLRDATNRLRVVFRDRFADLMFGDVQAMANHALRVGVNRILHEGLWNTEIHGEHSTGGRQPGKAGS